MTASPRTGVVLSERVREEPGSAFLTAAGLGSADR
jgi:hypothetical protein